MFRMFLKKKLQDGQAHSEHRHISRPSYRRNRRLHERYNVNQQELMVLNEQNILVIRDISAHGFSSDVSDQAYLKFIVGDIYDGRMKYFQELHDFKIKLNWKRSKVLGFELIEMSDSGSKFISRIIKPIQIAQNIKEITLSSNKDKPSNEVWMQCKKNMIDLHIWFKDDSVIEAWDFTIGDRYTQWDENNGLRTGAISYSQMQADPLNQGKRESVRIPDTRLNMTHKQFTFDLIMALESRYKHALLATIKG